MARMLRVAILGAAIAAMLTGCADGSRSTRAGHTTSAGQAARQLVGSAWVLTEISAGSRTLSVPESLKATWQFAADQQFLASDTVNAISGRYRLSTIGFATIDAASTLVGYAGSDPVRLAVIAAFRAMTSGPVSVEQSSTANIVMRVPGYVMTFRRTGPAITYPSPSSSSTAGN